MPPGPHGRQKLTQRVDTLGFPMLDFDEIVTILGELNIHTSVHDLNRPSPQSVQYLWIQILENLTGASPEMLDQPKRQLLGMLEYPEAYTDTMDLLLLYRHCRHVAEACQVHSFTFMDLTRPEPLKLRLVLSGITNFAKFRDDNSGRAERLQDDCHRNRQRESDLRTRLDTVEADIKDVEITIAEDAPKVDEQRAANSKLHAELVGMHAEHRKVVDITEDLKQQRTELSNTITEQDKELSQLSQQVKETKGRIVRSPDRIKRHISDMSHHVSTDRQQHAALVAKSRDLAKRLEVYGGLEAELRALIEIERDVETQRLLVEDSLRKRTALTSVVQQGKTERESQGERVKQLDRQIKNAEDRVARQKTMISDSRQEADAKIKALKAEYVEKSKERQAQGKLKEAIMQEMRAVEAERKEFIHKHDTELNELMERYWELRKDAEDYMNTLNAQLGLEEFGFHL